MIGFQSKFKVLRTRRADGVSASTSLSPMSGQGQCPSLKTVRQRAYGLAWKITQRILAGAGLLTFSE